jgi:hypothetical protein
MGNYSGEGITPGQQLKYQRYVREPVAESTWLTVSSNSIYVNTLLSIYVNTLLSIYVNTLLSIYVIRSVDF